MTETDSDPGPGLTGAEAAARLARFGPNRPTRGRARHPLAESLALVTNPLALVLLAAAAVTGWVGDVTGAGIIVTIVAAGAAINLIQTGHSSRAMARLREAIGVTATVRRDGAWVEVPRHQVVPGDLIRLGAGDLVPADGWLVSGHDLHVQQAALTGESLPVEKAPGPPAPDAPPRANDPHAVLFGTSVVSGIGTARVVATGARTAFGDLAARLADRAPETEFDRGTRRFGLFITQTVLVLVFAVLGASALLRRDPLESLLFAIALAVGLTPEFLPMITAVTLAAGAARMARKRVVVKHLAALQNLGSMDVLCSDKTGTLTKAEVELVRGLDPLGGPSDRPLTLAYLNSVFETGVRSPLDVAVLRHGPRDVSAYRKVDEVPFDFDRRRLSVAVDGPGGRVLVTKGAPESVLRCCTSYESGGRPVELDEAARRAVSGACAAAGADGLRLLAVAVKAAPGQAAFAVRDEAGLTLVGLLAFLDPPRDDAAEAMRALRADGVAVKVLTGDDERVARHVCGLVGIPADRVVLGDEVDAMTDPALGRVAEEVAVFARLSPGQKTRVFRALKARGHVVGYLGDGVNDAPALHAADVGVTVSSAADVAREAAEVVLLAPGLGVLHAGVREGRQAFGNVMKYLLMGTSSNFGNVLSMAVAVAVLPFLPMLPMQVLLNGLLYDVAQLAIPTDRVDPGFVRKPRRWAIGLVRRYMLVMGPLSSAFDLLTFWVLLRVFHADAPLFHTGWFVESLATQALVLFVIRTSSNPLASRPSRTLVASVAAVVAAGVYLPYSPLAGPLRLVPLPATYLLFVAAATAAYLLLVEGAKRLVLGRAIG